MLDQTVPRGTAPQTGRGRRAITLRRSERTGPVVYWMSRDQRCIDNWALSYADQVAREARADLMVTFCLVPRYLDASDRHFRFMLEGLRQVAQDLGSKGIRFDLLQGDPTRQLPKYLEEVGAATLVMDFDPLRDKTAWRESVVGAAERTCVMVDAHNIVPCWAASPKKEYAAATLRPKIGRLLPEFLTEMAADIPGRKGKVRPDLDWDGLLEARSDAEKVKAPPSGQTAALGQLEDFIAHRLRGYAEGRNDPNLDQQSGLSPYLHFGMISAQRVALQVRAADAPEADRAAFLEELIVRRELSDNLCHYDKGYDRVDCLPAWARISLREHERDRREYLYTLEELEGARTHDPLWNAAQTQLLRTGRMHGYLRMYWAKKMLEWSKDVAAALERAILLNDRHQWDGRDPNGYAGIAWCVGGLHDRAWPQRPIFGKVRYMSIGGARSKFDVDRFVERWSRS